MEDINHKNESVALLKTYDVENFSTIFLTISNAKILKLKLKYAENEKEVEISNNASVLDLKAKLNILKQFPISPVLSFGEIEMKSTFKLI